MEQAEARRIAQEKAEQERLAIERAEGERLSRLNGLYEQASAAAGASRWEEAQRLFTQLEREAPGYRDTPAQLSRVALELAKPASMQPPAATGVMKAAAPAWTEQIAKAGDLGLERAGVKQPAGKPSYWKAIGYHLLLGFGLFKVDPDLKRKWIYPVAAIFIVLVFVTPLGYDEFYFPLSIPLFFISWGLYLAGFIDTVLTLRKRHQLTTGGTEAIPQESSKEPIESGRTWLQLGIALFILMLALFNLILFSYNQISNLIGLLYLLMGAALFLPQLKPYRRRIRWICIGFILLTWVMRFFGIWAGPFFLDLLLGAILIALLWFEGKREDGQNPKD